MTSNTFVPILIPHSCAEAEHNACTYALMDTIHVKQLWNLLNRPHFNSTMTFVLFTDSKRTMTMIDCDHVTRHIEKHVHFVEQARMQGLFQVIQIPGELIPADVGNKNFHLNRDTRKHLTAIHSYSPLYTDIPFEDVPQVKEECRKLTPTS